MIESSEAYKNAIIGDARRTYLRAVVDISDPDIVYGEVSSESKAAFANGAQLHDRVLSYSPPVATLENDRWLLDGSFEFVEDDHTTELQTAYVSKTLSDENGGFSAAQYAEMTFSNVDILQACSVWFSDRAEDGIPVDFTVEVKQGGAVYFTKTFTNNAATRVSMDGFTVYNPDAIRVTVTKWSLPGRRMRVVEIVAGFYEIWGNNELAYFNVTQQADVSNVSIPYGTCELRMDNLDRRFEPRAKAGLFQSIEERQGIEISIGVKTPDGIDYKPAGIFYQFSAGWKTSDNGLSIQWNLVDIIGLLADREFVPPSTLPTTLSGWIAALVSQLGVNFAQRYTVDSNYASAAVTANSREDVTGKTCGDILRFACMAAGVWARADAETGYLAAEPLWSQGNRLTIDNLISYPVMMANNDVGAIVFTLHDGSDNGTQYVVGGTSAASSETVSIDNPFLHTAAQALTAARLMLSAYGGNRLETTGRGDPSAEIGDVETVELDEYSAMSARRIFQTFSYHDGVLQQCQSALLQADGGLEFEERVFLTGSGTWTAPAGVTQLRVILGGGGQGGTAGTAGTWEKAGEKGADGAGGRIWYGTININPSQSFAYSSGAGGLNGAEGGATSFGSYSSANGRVYDPSYTDIINGDAYGRSGAANPRANTSDGGAGGAGGVKGNQHTVSGSVTRYYAYEAHETYYQKVQVSASKYQQLVDSGVDKNTLSSETSSYTQTVIDNYPGHGNAGQKGADGFILIYYSKG